MTDVKHCELPTCGKILERRDYEWPRQFAVRKTCDRVCGRKLIHWRSENKKPHRKKCARESCDVILVQRDNQTTSHFNVIKYCEAHRTSKVDTPPKNCKRCGKQFTRRKNETTIRYGERQSCGDYCGRKLPRSRPAKPTHKCALARCTEMIPLKKKYCTSKHCGEDQRLPPEVKLARKREADKKYEERRLRKRKSRAKPKRKPKPRDTKIVNHAKPVVRPKGETVFGDREPDYIWRPEAFGGPIPKQRSEAS